MNIDFRRWHLGEST